MNVGELKKAILGDGDTQPSDPKCPNCGASKMKIIYVSGMHRVDVLCQVCGEEIHLGNVDKKPNIVGIIER